MYEGDIQGKKSIEGKIQCVLLHRSYYTALLYM